MSSEIIFASIIAVISAFGTGLVTVYVSHYLAEYTNLTDDPDRIRKLHEQTTPTSGGLGMIVSLISGVGVYWLLMPEIQSPFFQFLPYFAVSLILISATGLYDDFSGLSSKPKFLMQAISGLVLIAGLHFHIIPTVHSYAVLSWQLIPIYTLALFWIVAVCNMINLVDGVDGLASALSLIILFGLGWISYSWSTLSATWLIYPLVGAISAFLVYNKPPATIFMGDTGSLMIGFSLATASLLLVINATHWMYSFSLILPFGVPMIDTLLSIVRRIKDGQNPFESDSNHLHHLIQRHYSSPAMAITILGSVTTLLVLLGILLANTNDTILFSTVFGIIMLLFGVTVVAYVKQLGQTDSIIGVNLYEAPSIPEAEIPALESIHNNNGNDSFDVTDHSELRQFSNN